VKISQELAHQAVYALLDILDGVSVGDIEASTGFSPARCLEIHDLHLLLLENYQASWLQQT